MVGKFSGYQNLVVTKIGTGTPRIRVPGTYDYLFPLSRVDPIVLHLCIGAIATSTTTTTTTTTTTKK